MDVDGRIAALFGASAVEQIATAEGVIHVTAVWRRPDGGAEVLAINDDTPKSETDFFLLRLARARVDAIVATGKILRDEPNVRFTLDGPDGAALSAWRRERRGRSTPPTIAILSSGRGLDFDHPALAGGAVLYTGRAFEAPDHIRVVVLAEPSARAVLSHLAADGHRSVLIEAGPSTNRELYDPPLAVDELMLSELDAEALPNGVRAGAFLDAATLASRMKRLAPPSARTEHGAPWMFSRFSARR